MARPRFSVSDIHRLTRSPVTFPGARAKKPIAVGQGMVSCPHCGEPIPIRVIIGHIDFIIQAPALKTLKGA